MKKLTEKDNKKLKKPDKIFSYKNSGVDLKAAEKAIELIKKPVFSTFNKNVLNDLTSYAGLFCFEKERFKEPVLVSSTDGVGTKLLLAKQTGIYKNVGQDLVAMCINDIICCGATPLFFLDYIACGKVVPGTIELIVSSIAESCRLCEASLIGGEIAEMPGMYKKDDIDLAGFAIGVVEKKSIINPGLVKKGDLLLGIASSGLHSNGFSLVRKIIREKGLDLKKDYNFKSPELKGRQLGQIFMEPTRLYFSILKDIYERGIILNGIAHITGGGFYGNINRIIPENMDALIYENRWPIHEVFNFLKEKALIGRDEAYRVFNMGIGMVIAISPEHEKAAMDYSLKSGEKIYNLGIVEKGSGKVVIVKK